MAKRKTKRKKWYSNYGDNVSEATKFAKILRKHKLTIIQNDGLLSGPSKQADKAFQILADHGDGMSAKLLKEINQ